MADVKHCEFYLLRYTPNLIEGVSVPVAVVLLEQAPDGFTGVRFARHWARVRQIDPLADIELLQSYEAELQRILESRTPEIINYRGPMSRRDWLLEQMQQSFSGALQLDLPVAINTQSPADEVAELARMFLDKVIHAERAGSGRRIIYNAMRDAFDHAGVWDSMSKNIEVSKYAADDPLKIDCAYTTPDIINLFQAVSLATEVNAAKALAFSYQEFRKPMQHVEGREPNLYAVVEDGLDRNDAGVAFALAALDRYGIDVATTSQMPAIAERARIELNL